jgi:hypothetical protein
MNGNMQKKKRRTTFTTFGNPLSRHFQICASTRLRRWLLADKFTS